MDSPPTSDGFDIISAIRSDAILLYSWQNTWVNAEISGTAARSPAQFYMLSYHLDRMLNAAEEFGWDTSPLEGPKAFAELLEKLHDHLEREHNDRNHAAPLKLRIALSANGKFTITSDGPHPGPATIEGPLRLIGDNPISQLYPGSLSSVADPILGAAYLRWRVFVSPNKVTPTKFTMHKTSNRGVYDEALAPAQPLGLGLNNHQLQTEVLIVNDSEEVMEGCKCTPYFLRDNEWITPKGSCGGNFGTTRRWAVEKGLCKLGVVTSNSVKCGEIIVLSNGARGFQSGIVEPWKSLLEDDTKQ